MMKAGLFRLFNHYRLWLPSLYMAVVNNRGFDSSILPWWILGTVAPKLKRIIAKWFLTTRSFFLELPPTNWVRLAWGDQMKLTQNVGPLDRATRLVLGSILMAAPSFFKVGGVLGAVIFWLGLVTAVEGILGYCFLYGLFGWSTRRKTV